MQYKNSGSDDEANEVQFIKVCTWGIVAKEFNIKIALLKTI